MQITESIFKAYDIRGLVPEEITEDFAHALGRALADFLPQPGAVAVGYDMRPDSEALAAKIREGLVRQGRNVLDIGRVTSDMIYFAAGKYGLAGGAMVTASHNPGKYNGIKLCREMAQPIGIETGLLDIKKVIIEDNFADVSQVGSVETKDVTEDWIKHALSFVDVASWPAYKVAVDAGNGMAGAIIPSLEHHVPVKITEMYFELDGTFPNHPASPIEIENLQDLVKKIKDENLDFGIAFDGDGDRAFFVDENGEQVTGTILTAIIAEAMLKKYPGATILYNAICGRIVPETISQNGGKGIRTRVGHSNIKADMRKYNAVFAGEASGHFYFKNNWNADTGLIAALVGVDLLSKSGLKLSELAGKYKKYFTSVEINSEIPNPNAKVEELAKKYQDGVQDRLDGITVNYPDWWFNARPSNTEPLLRLSVEANSKELMEQKRDEVLALIRA